MRLLVTGGAGFIGSHLVQHWVAAHPADHVVVVDLLTYAADPAALAELGPQVTLVPGDVADTDLMQATMRDHDIEAVVHLAAESHNSLAVVDPTRFVHTNLLGTFGVLDAARRAGVERFHHVSTCEVYGDLALDDPSRFSPEAPYRPNTPYSASKAGADHLVRAYHQTYGMAVTISCGANTYGPRQFPEKAVPLFAVRALRGEPLPVYASSDHRREWIHVDDHVAALAAVVLEGEAGRTYHVGSGVERSVAEIAAAVLDAAGQPRSLVERIPDRPGHDRRYLLDSSATEAELGWAPQVAFDEGLARTVAWYRDHRDWWEPRLARLPIDERRAQPRPP
ncbi:MAG: dTDP-glucose 4,6-dehydratase [Acidimicrobiales bacterium]|nr:dTDP-glucose 4,6-dehydratase [Acidimicrobiales bacterium]